MNIGQKIRQQRKLKKMTQEQLGDAIGVSKMAISKYERNIVDNMGREKVMALSKLLDIPIVEFLESSDEKHNVDQVSPEEFANEVRMLLDKTNDLTEQQKQHLLNTLNFICGEDE
jgi:transcriptional regulator with XRE-family HTH domain